MNDTYSITNNIALYRKRKGYTQEQLGELLGVTNRAVSKWESGISMPDIMLLPKIVQALDITLEELYGIKTREEKIKADDFPAYINKKMTELFHEHAQGDKYFNGLSNDKSLRHTFDSINKGWEMTCISDINGAVYVSKDFSFAELDYKTPESEGIFESREIGAVIQKLSSGNVRKILAYMYKNSFADNETPNKEFLLSDIEKQCGLNEDEAFEAMEKLKAIGIVEAYVHENTTEYVFLKSRAIFALVAFKAIKLISKDPMWHIVRDTSTITDYAFEKLW